MNSAPRARDTEGSTNRTPSLALVPPSAYPMRERSPVPCAQPSPRRDAPSPLAFAKSCKGGDVSVLDPALAWDVRFLSFFLFDLATVWSTVWNALAGFRPKMSASKGLVLAPFLYAWVSEDECAPDLRGHQSRLRPTAIPPALECRSATRFTPRLRAASRSGDDARPPPTPP